MAECDVGMLRSCGMCVTHSSSCAEDCQVLLTSCGKLLHCSAWHPLTPSHVLGHSFSSTRESAHISVWAWPLPIWTHLFLSSGKRLTIASLIPQDPLDLSSQRAWDKASLHWVAPPTCAAWIVGDLRCSNSAVLTAMLHVCLCIRCVWGPLLYKQEIEWW